MLNSKINKILIIDDDNDTLELLKSSLNSKGYKVDLANNGEEALEKIYHDLPHLVIMDLIMPGISGYDIVKKIRKDMVVSHIPIIMLTGKKDIQTEIESLEFGVDDFIAKPFKLDELLAKVQSLLYRTYKGLDANPLTRLPGNNSIRERIEDILLNNEAFAVCFLDIDNFKAFNDKYGFERGDTALNLTAQIIIKSIKKYGNENDFIGHIGGDDFVIITKPSTFHNICQNIINLFDKSIVSLYDEEDLNKGYIISINRQGKIEKFPVMTISIGIVTNKNKKIIHSAQISEIGNELKKFAKIARQSNYVTDERKNSHSHFITPYIQNIQKNLNREEDFMYFNNIEKNLQSILRDMQIFMNNKEELGMLFVDVALPKINEDNHDKINLWRETFNNISQTFFNSQGEFLRKKDIISIYNTNRDKIFIYLSSSRTDKCLKTDDIEKIIQRIENYFKTLNLNIKGLGNDFNINILFGYSLINFPCVRINK
ncbi:MAG: response regulator [Candidatus Firestonebacteria bacterium]|nr:response regulator [Candidatus Firestonebacteria bacterium]